MSPPPRAAAASAAGEDPSGAEKLIEIRDATVYRGSTRVFEDLCLEVAHRRNTVILGPNGAGKSTLLKLLTRELYPVARAGASVRVFGREKWNVWELRGQLGIVSHELQSSYAARARGLNVVLSGYYSSLDTWGHQRFSAGERDQAVAVMETLGVAHLRDKLFGEMSTGEQRRFLLGRALISAPDTLILDEPTSGLDLKATFRYVDTVRALMREGRTVVLVTHHLHEIPPEIDDVILLKGGRVVAAGDKASVLTDERISSLFEIPVRLVGADGFVQAVPAAHEAWAVRGSAAPSPGSGGPLSSRTLPSGSAR